MAMPETGRDTGTPASIIASEQPHTVAIEDEPFDSVISETRRIVYGNSSCFGSTAREAYERMIAMVSLAEERLRQRRRDRVRKRDQAKLRVAETEFVLE